MGRRYIAFLPADRADSRPRARFLRERNRSPSLAVAADRPGLIVLATAQAIALGEHGVVLGEVIRAEGAAPLDRLEAHDVRTIAVCGGEPLIRNFWGAYVALLEHADGSIRVLRAPLGDLPAYAWRSPEGVAIASDVELLARFAGYRPAIDWTGVAEHLAAADLRRPRTCLAGIEELPGGAEGCWRDGHWSVRQRWSPWHAIARDAAPVDLAAAAAHVGDVVRRSVAARTARYRSLLVLLSGGLDSSIVAASLAAAGRPILALTMVTRDPGGDERHYAAATASALGIPLTAIGRDVGQVDVTRSLACGLPRPSARSFAQATHAAAQALARDAGARAIVTGGGGDNVFCALQSVAPAADRLLLRGPDRQFRATAGHIATLAQVSVLRVAAKAFARALRRRRGYRFAVNTGLLTPDAIAMAAAACEHPWLRPPPRALPGSAAHIGLIVAAQSVAESPDPRAAVPQLAPLIVQPIVEACVAVPSWAWFDRGCNRAVARHAFTDGLPAEIAWRRSKGAMDSFVVEIFEANRAALADLLLDGRLASHGLIDRAALEIVLQDRGPTRSGSYARAMELADVEAWARSWPR
ncbi:asparagine synthase-related protein [Sphingomonas cannabina]|uniref:asparagine synthase-related protein n=1 Tax=Sphingomonas cannabina TaxID=2899123 RepID=UPI001F4561B5|nr:asparagine synthase-related protein [Sphingomonas cannabina]UIJ44795.1 asparagine synthase-related protein [Sphingomonas cannabina]